MTQNIDILNFLIDTQILTSCNYILKIYCVRKRASVIVQSLPLFLRHDVTNTIF